MNVIFHYPHPLDPNAKSASGKRPYMMKKAFEDCGCRVDVVVGNVAHRRNCIAKIKKNILAGTVYDFIYSESSTQPTLLTEPHHLPLNPFVDFGFFKFAKEHGIKIGLFYRDIYWMFPDYESSVGKLKAHVAKFLYRYDLRQYEKLLDILYLPSIKMGEYIPRIKPSKIAELPPGHSGNLSSKGLKLKFNRNQIKLLYIGGFSSHYQMQKLFKAVCQNKRIRLTVCTREKEWLVEKSSYEPFLAENISIVHLSGDDLEPLYADADLSLLFFAPLDYRNFAVPFKLFEYLGQVKPIIASKGTLAGKFVADNQIGWTIPYSVEALLKLFSTLLDRPGLIDTSIENCANIAKEHSWSTRVQKVMLDLKGSN